ncbi:MAG: Abi family protein [Mariprofundus sp.]
MTAFIKPAISIPDQCQKWIDRGLSITNRSQVEHYLLTIGYYRLSAYSLPFQVSAELDHNFKPDVCFDDIRKLYIFDRELRLLVLDAIERIKVAFRSQFNNHMALTYGAHWYLDASHFLSSYNHNYLLRKIRSEMGRSTETFLQSYLNKYTIPDLPPSWMVTEMLTFGQLSKVYENLACGRDRKAIARGMNTSADLLCSWMQSASDVRNICAHHSRLWNREIGTSPKVPKKPKGKWIRKPILIANPNIRTEKKIYLLLSILEYLLQAVNLTSTWHERLKDLMDSNPQISRAHMGMPDDWDSDPFWRFSSKKSEEPAK